MPQDAGRSLEERASCLSRLFLSWFTDLMHIGSKKVLEQEDLGGLAKLDESEFNYCKLMELWEEEVKQRGLENKTDPFDYRGYTVTLFGGDSRQTGFLCVKGCPLG